MLTWEEGPWLNQQAATHLAYSYTCLEKAVSVLISHIQAGEAGELHEYLAEASLAVRFLKHEIEKGLRAV